METRMILKQLRTALVAVLLLTAVTGGLYPAVVTLVAQLAFPEKANGSLLKRGDKVLGSALIGQPFSDPRYFWGRPSFTSPHPYNAGASAGSNLGPLNPVLAEAVAKRVGALREADPENTGPIPVDLVTGSGSGLDPHISVAAALYQVRRVARARGMSDEEVRSLVDRHTEGRQWGLLGEPRVNVLKLNLDLPDGRGSVEAYR
jgi:K+-transporting ATPase ATPase C chain